MSKRNADPLANQISQKQGIDITRATTTEDQKMI